MDKRKDGRTERRTDQARIQVLGLEGAKFGEGSRDRLGPQSGPGRSPGGGPGGGGSEAPRKLQQLSDLRV